MSRRSAPPRPRFVVDAMLGSLARKLRIFGFDTLYFKEGTDEELLSLAREEGRTLLTADVALWRAAAGRALLVKGADDRVRMAGLAGQVPDFAALLELGESRCAVCNGELEKVSRRDAAASLSGGEARHRAYYRCLACGKVYWHGKHWERLRRLSSDMRKKKRLT